MQDGNRDRDIPRRLVDYRGNYNLRQCEFLIDMPIMGAISGDYQGQLTGFIN
jgi:hypothetical protein